jgi:hypothetical protein
MTSKSFMSRGTRAWAAVGAAASVIATVLAVGTGPSALAVGRADAPAGATAEPVVAGGPAAVRRLNRDQYVRSIEQTFGPGIKVPGRFDPPVREHGLLAIGDAKAVVSLSGIEQYELRAREVSAQVLAPARRQTALQCAPASPKTFDSACADQFLGKYGRLLFRRPLDKVELASASGVARATTTSTGDFYKGLEAGLARLLASPNFIFRVERSERAGNALRLDSYSLASRVSFLLWDAPPDVELLDAAASGTLTTQPGLEAQVDRMMASPKFAEGVRAFFSDMFAYDQFEGLTKDQGIYPKYTSQMARDAEEQTLRTIVDLLVTNKGDYRDLFTTKKTFMNRNLGSLYQVRLDNTGVSGWAPYTFEQHDPRAGILTFGAFLMLDPTHAGKTSPTTRGKSLRELLMCQPVPTPPANVDFTQFQDPKNPNATVRERLAAHRENPVCAGCHSFTDPIGLSMENYNAIGEFRTAENGKKIDASGEMAGRRFDDLVGLGQVLRDDPSVPACVVQRTFEYGVGRQAEPTESAWLEYMAQRFGQQRYVFTTLIREVAVSKAFRMVAPEKKVNVASR